MRQEMRPISGFEEYLATLDGDVYSTKNGKLRKMHPSVSGSIYLQVMLSPPGRPPRPEQLHHLILLAYVGPRPLGARGLHKDDDPFNNHYTNLIWGTAQQNTNQAIANGRRNGYERSLRVETVLKIKEMSTHKSINHISKELNIPYQVVWRIVKGLTYKEIIPTNNSN